MKKYELPFPIETEGLGLLTFSKQVADHVLETDDGNLSVIDTSGCAIAPHYILNEYDEVYKLWKDGELKEIPQKLSPRELAKNLRNCSAEELLQTVAMYEHLAEFPDDTIPEELHGKELYDFIRQNLDESIHGICEELSDTIESEYSSLCMRTQWNEKFAEEREEWE